MAIWDGPVVEQLNGTAQMSGNGGIASDNKDSKKVETAYIIDKNAAFLRAERPCYTPEDALPPADGVLITVMTGEAGGLAERIREKLKVPVFCPETVIGEMTAEYA